MDHTIVIEYGGYAGGGITTNKPPIGFIEALRDNFVLAGISNINAQIKIMKPWESYNSPIKIGSVADKFFYAYITYKNVGGSYTGYKCCIYIQESDLGIKEIIYKLAELPELAGRKSTKMFAKTAVTRQAVLKMRILCALTKKYEYFGLREITYLGQICLNGIGYANDASTYSGVRNFVNAKNNSQGLVLCTETYNQRVTFSWLPDFVDEVVKKEHVYLAIGIVRAIHAEANNEELIKNLFVASQLGVEHEQETTNSTFTDRFIKICAEFGLKFNTEGETKEKILYWLNRLFSTDFYKNFLLDSSNPDTDLLIDDSSEANEDVEQPVDHCIESNEPVVPSDQFDQTEVTEDSEPEPEDITEEQQELPDEPAEIGDKIREVRSKLEKVEAEIARLQTVLAENKTLLEQITAQISEFEKLQSQLHQLLEEKRKEEQGEKTKVELLQSRLKTAQAKLFRIETERKTTALKELQDTMAPILQHIISSLRQAGFTHEEAVQKVSELVPSLSNVAN